VVGTTATFWGSVYAIFLQGLNRVAELRRQETLFSLGAIGSSVVVLHLGVDLLGLVLVNQCWNVATVVRNRHLCRQLAPFPRRAALDRALLAQLWPSAWRSGVGVLLSFGLIYGSTLLYAQHENVAEVSSYLFATRLMQILVTFSQAPFYSKLPLLARLYAENRRPDLLALAQTGMQRAHGAVEALGRAMAIVRAEPLYYAPIAQRDLAPELWALMGLAFLVERYGAMHIQLYSLTNHIVWHLANGVTGTLYLVLAGVLYPRWGVMAFPVSMLAGYAAFYAWFAGLRAHRAFGLPFWSFEGRTVAVPLTAMFLYTLYCFLT